MQVRLDHDLALPARLLRGAPGRLDEVADPADLEHERVRGARDRFAAQPGDQTAALSRGGASAWQIATASASAAWFGVGGFGSPRIALTIFCTCTLSACP